MFGSYRSSRAGCRGGSGGKRTTESPAWACLSHSWSRLRRSGNLTSRPRRRLRHSLCTLAREVVVLGARG